MKKILLVDDEESVLMLYRVELEDDGYEVITALTGEEGLRKFSDESPDLVVLDIQMPGMNGIDTLRQMKMNNPGVPIILSSAHNEYKQDLGAWASDAYVVKSAVSTDLKEAVRNLLS